MSPHSINDIRRTYSTAHFLISAFEQEFISLSPNRFPKPVFFDPLSLIAHFLIHITTYLYFTFCLKICETQCLCLTKKHIKKESSIHLHLGSRRSTTPLRRLFLLSFSAGWWKTWRKGHEKQRKVLKLLQFRGFCIIIFDWKFMLSSWKSRWLRACTSQSKLRRNCYVVHDLSFGQDFLIARN